MSLHCPCHGNKLGIRQARMVSAVNLFAGRNKVLPHTMNRQVKNCCSRWCAPEYVATLTRTRKLIELSLPRPDNGMLLDLKT